LKKTKIFVTVGSTYPFDRLIREVDGFGSNFEVFAQIGESSIKPKNIKYKKILNNNQINKKIKWANIVISHAGMGSIIDLISLEKKFILLPRLKKFDEAIDDHQVEICEAFEKKYSIKWTKNEKELKKLLNGIKPFKLNKKRKLEKEIEKIIKTL
jgi:UDP-N-acetylglucosamine transferase subunit ALG13